MSRLFISHSSRNDDWAIALRDWLVREGWSGLDDIFLDLDPERGLAAGERWAHALEDAATRCEAVLFLVSEAWLASKWCADEYHLASQLNKKLFALLIEDVALDRLPGGLSAQWQVVRLTGEPAERFLVVHPLTQRPAPVHVAVAGLASLKRGLEKAGIGPETFTLQADPAELSGWRAPYRGLAALEPEDAAVFFGRSADIVRGIDALRGLAARKPPRLLVILGDSGAGKSSFLRAGLWPRLLRDDSQWLPLRAIRAGRGGTANGGAVEGIEGLLAALDEVHRRFALRASRADLRARLQTPEAFVQLLKELRQAAARRAHLSEPPYPLPVICLDQGEELFAADAGAESEKLLTLARAAADADAALILVTIRTDAYGLMQNAPALAGMEQTPLSLGPVPQGEIARIIREPAEVMRGKAGPASPVFDPAVVERLQAEVAGERDALPLLAFVLQRLMREHAGAGMIGVAELDRTGGVAAAIEREAEAALADAGYGPDRGERREVLRRLFIPRLARIERASKSPQRRVARQRDLPADLAPLARALTARRLMVAKVATAPVGEESGVATLEVAHEALLRHWPTLADLLAEDRDALIMLDGALSAAIDWERAESTQKADFLVHRGSRLADAQALAARGPDWARELAPARPYLEACQVRETAERAERETALAEREAALARSARLQRRAQRLLAAFAGVVVLGFLLAGWLYATNLQRQAQLDRGQVNLLAEVATRLHLQSNGDSALRLSVHAARLDLRRKRTAGDLSVAPWVLAAAVWQSGWRQMLGGHEDNVHSAVFSPDGARILTASRDKTARIWDAATGKELAVLRGHEDDVVSAAFSPGGARILTASRDSTARVWDAATGKELAVLRGHEADVPSAVFNADGTRIVTASSDRTARVWEAATGRELAVLRGHEGDVRFAAFSPDGVRIVTASSDRTARVWEAATGKELAVLRGHKGEVWSAVFSSDATRIVTASWDRTARVWEAATGKELAVLRGHEGEVWSAVFSRDSARILTTSSDRTARVWDAATGQELAVLRGHEAEVRSAVFSPDSARIVTASSDRSARVWEAATGQELAVLRGHEAEVRSAVFNPDGARIVTASSDRTARVWEAATGQELAVLRGHEAEVRSAVFSPDGARIVTASSDRSARVWDAATGRELMVLPGHEAEVRSPAFSPDGARIVTASSDRTARVWNAATGKELAVLRGHEGLVWSAVFSSDGVRIVTASWDRTARVWEAVTGREIAVLRGHQADVLSAVFSPDGARIVTASSDRTARVWDAATGNELAVLRAHEGGVWSAVFSPDGARIVTASSDRSARVWDAATGKELAVLRGHGGSVRSAVFSPDGARVVTASSDRTARAWDAATGREIAALNGHEGLVWSAVFNADGARIVTASSDRTARVWDAAIGREIAVLRGHLDEVHSAALSPDGTRLVTASVDNTARIWGARFATMPTEGLIDEVCLRRLRGRTALSRDEMRLAGYADDVPAINVCAGIKPRD